MSEVIAQVQIRMPFALKHGDTFLVADTTGDITNPKEGMFDNDTRVLSYLKLTLAGHAPEPLSASVSRDNVYFVAHMTNRRLPLLGTPEQATPEGVLHLARRRLIFKRRLYECLTLTNFSVSPAQFPLEIRFGVDFHDLFEVRGRHRRERGQMLPPRIGTQEISFRYEGLDGLERRSVIAFSPAPDKLEPGLAEFRIELAPYSATALYLEVGPQVEEAPSQMRFRGAAAAARKAMRREIRRGARVASSTALFTAWLEKSAADLALLTTELETGPYPYAGIPWFSTVFGRDAIITALQTLWLNPELARGVLRFLARNQAREHSAFQDAAPGKILHEMRKGEMPAHGEVPFARYYGGVDTTPLFVLLAGAYARRTADLSTIEELWPALLAAMQWIEGEGDSNKDGFLDYARGAETGLKNQGWKDSQTSVFHADGSFPNGPIALVEVQGYVYAARLAMAELAERRGDQKAAKLWRQKAEALRAAVEACFWMEDIGFYGLALDGHGELCRVRTSNAGQLLWSGLPSPERANRVIRMLASPAFNSGWGIRTLATGEPHYNPMSYHNGSVWPHDTALCLSGMARYAERSEVVRILSQMHEAAVHFGFRLPELFCGFQRAPGESPIPYPVACMPQAWAAGSVFMLLQAVLGLSIDGATKEIRLERPALPPDVHELRLRGLPLGERRVDLRFQQVGGRVVCMAEGQHRGKVRIVLEE